MDALGTPFIVFRDKVLDELKVSEEPKEKLLQHVMEQIMETGPFLDSLAKAGEEREKKLSEHRKKARGKARQGLEGDLEPRAAHAASSDRTPAGAWIRPRPGRASQGTENHGPATEAIRGHHAGIAKEGSVPDQGGGIGRQAGGDSTEGSSKSGMNPPRSWRRC